MPRVASLTLTSHSARQTIAIGRLLGRVLTSGHVVALEGMLGAGKTTLSKGIALGLDVAEATDVKSPTFVLIREYAARVPVYHIDLYRLDHAVEATQLGLEQYLDSDGVCLVEWADKFPGVLSPEYLRVSLRHQQATTRLLQFTPYGSRYVRLLDHFRAVLARAAARST